MRMRIMEKTIAVLLVICMLFSFMPTEMMSGVLEDVFADIPSSSNFQGTFVFEGEWNPIGPMSRNTPIIRVVLSRDSDTYLNGSKEAYNNMLNAFSYRYPISSTDTSKHTQNTLFFSTQAMYDKWTYHVNITGEERLWKAPVTYYSGNPTTGCISKYGEDVRNMFVIFKGSSKNNTFKTKVVNAYNNKTIGGSTDLAGGVWKNYLPTQAEAYALCSYLFTRESGFQERVLEVVDQNFNMSNLDVKNLDNKGKFNIIAGYTGLLSALYVVADAQGQKDLASAYDTAIEDYLSNNNIKQQPVTLIVDTCLLFTENNGTRHIMPSIDVVEYSLATNSNFSILDDDAFLKNLEKAGKRKTTITSTSGRTKGFSLREQIEEMAWASLEAYPFATTKGYINGSNDTTQKKVYRLADLPNLNSIYTNQQHGNPLGYCLTVVSLAAASDPSGKGRGEMFTSSGGPLWNSYDWGSGHFLDIFYTGENGFLDGFAIMGSHMSDPNPSADFTVVDTLQGSPDTCEEFVQLITPTKITVNIGNGSDFLAFLDTLPEDSKISLSANISRTEYKNSLKGAKVDYIEHLTALENDLFLDKVSVETFKNKVVKTIILEDDYFLDSSGSPKTYTRSTNDASLVIFEYAIDLTLTVDETVYEFKSDDIVSRIGDVPQNSSSFQIKAYKSNTTPAEDIEIIAPEDRTKPNYTHNPSAQEDLAHNTQVVRWYEFTSVMGSLSSNVDASFGSTMGYDDLSVDADIGAFAEIKSNTPGDEKYEVLGGIPSTEELYFSVGGSEWKVSMIMQYWMNEHSRDRTYTMHFDGTTCEFNNNQKDNGDIWEGITLPSASGASQSTTRFEHTGTTVTATWTGTIYNGNASVSQTDTQTASGCGGSATAKVPKIPAVVQNQDYVAAVANANAWMQAMANLSTNLHWKAASDEVDRDLTITAMNMGTGKASTTQGAAGDGSGEFSDRGFVYGSYSYSFSNPADVDAVEDTVYTSCITHVETSTDSEGNTTSTTVHDGDTTPSVTVSNHGSANTSYSITVTYTIEAHTICGPCCGHVLPDLWDTWKQGLVFDYMKISQIRLFLLDQGSVEGMTDLTGTDRITASVVSGNPTYFMNIATHTEQIRDPYMTAGGTSDLEGTKQGNTWFTHTEYSSSAVYGELPHLSTYNTREAQSSRAGRIRYLLDANWEATATKSFNYQYGPGGTTDGVGGNKSGTLTIDYNKVANSKHHDDVVYDLGTRTPNCDGMATTANFGKEGTKNETPMLTTGHVNKWADGMLYTNIMDLEDFSTYWDTGSYGNSYTPTQMRDNDKNLVKFKEDYGHHNPEDGLTKTGYGHHADIVDSRTAEWQVFDAARKTKIVAVVISDFLIMQTSGGDQAVFYYEKASEPTEAQEHFQKVSIPEEELTTNNPLSVFNAGAVCESSSLKEGIANFEIVGGYNGRYDVPSKKYMPYSLVTKQFLSNNSNSWSVYNTSYQISNGKITNADKKIGVESNYNKYGNSKIVTIFDDDPAGSFNRPARQAEGTGLKIYQDNLQILPTTPNKYYQPNNASIWYIQVLGMFSAGGPYYNHATGTYNVHTAGNVNLGHPYREKYGSAWTDYWGVEFGLQLNTKYYLTPNGDSNTGTVNGVVVYTPVSAEDAIILPQGDLNVNGVTVSRDQRVDNFAFPNMNEIANALKVCTLDPATCEYRYLDCKYLHDTVVAEFDFEDSYSVSGKTYVTNNITGIEYALPSGYSVSSGTSFANSSGRYLVATGTNSWSIPFADLGLSNDKTNRVKVSMDLYVTTSARDVMISGFRNLGFIVDTSGQGKFIIPELNDPTMLGTSKSFTQNMKKVHLDIVFGFNNIIDCTAYVNGVEATVHQVVDFRNQWTETVVNGQTIRKLEQTHVVLDANALRTTPPRNLSTGDIMASLNIGTWGNTESTYNASFYLDNLSVVLMGGSTEHTSACYVTATTHAVSKVHVCDENCYLQSDLYTCDGLPNANYQLLCGAEPMTYTYKGFAQSVTLTPGTYRIEAWGASGGGDPSMVGQGGYTAGTVTLTQNTTFYIYVGQQGTRTTSGTPAPATFNGGGNGVGAMSTAAADAAHWGGSGGGATDIRLVGGDWNNTAGLQSRILVAGGGGGSGCASSHNPGHGGGLTGVNTINSGYYFGAQAYGGTQTAGGYGNGQTSTNGGSSYWSCDRKQGSFGKGADAAQCGAGGGGGYYGGGSNYTAGGGGGSSYVTGYTGCDTTYRSQQGGYNFTDVVMAQGGNTGNGKVAITKLDSGASLNYYGAPTCNNLPLNTGTGTKTLYKFVHASGCTYSGYTHYYTSTTCYCGHTCNRQSATVTLNAGEYVWYHNSHYADYHISTSNTKCTVCGSSTGSVIVSNPATSHVHSGTPGWTANGCYTTPTEHRHEGTAGLDYANGCYGRPTEHKHTLSYSYVQKELTCTIPVGGNGDVQTFDYTGNIQSVNLPAGRYKLEVWGAQGGGHSYGTNQNISYGGYGGYSYGTITLSSPTVLYVVVGGSGGYTSAGNYTSYHNGYNGGGTVTAASNGNAGQAGGGGATHIATATGLLSSLSSNRSAVLIVAGGGGGTEHVSASSEVCGGAGGGLTGGIATKEAGSSTAATQSSGYSFGQGQGVSSQHMGSGGGGWYGGYAGTSTNTIGNGGSGYIGGVSDGVSESGKRGNNAIIGLDGYAKITNLDHQHTDACYKSTTVNHNSACPKEAKGTYKCTGEPNTLTDFNVHVHDINCFYNYYDLTPRTYQATGGVITYMVPYTDVYKIETWGAANQDSGTRSGYASGYVKLTRGTRLYFYIGTKDGFNDGNTDIRTYDIMYSYDEIMDMESGADRHEWLLAYEQSLASRFINAGGNQAESFVRNVGQYSLTSGVTSTVGNSSDGRIIITPQNRLPLEKDDTYILEQIIQGDISEEQVEKYLGKELADLIINATQPFATFENFSWNNYKGIAKSQNNYSFKNGNIVVDVAKGGCYEFILPVNISARALRRVVVTFDNYTSSTNFGLAINQANDAHRILKPITANKANQTVEFNVRDLAWDETVTKLIFNPSTNTNLGKVVIKKIELFGHAEYTEFTPNSTYTYDNIATITGFSSTNTNGFVVGNNVQLSYNNSDLRVKAIGSDPITLWNSVKSIPTGSVKAIKIVFKNDQTSASTGQLFYKDGTGTFNETDSFSWHVGASSYGYQTVWIDCVNHSTYNETTDTFMTGGSGWTGTITGMRFDWTTASNATIDVKEITFIGKGSVSIKHTFNYLEKAQAIKLTSGKWNLDLYGAQGGDGRVVNTTTMVEAGGKGGRTQGTLTANGSTTYYVYVGGKGGAATSGSLTYGAGGWNGGAPGGTELSGESYPENGAGGGGMTHITTSSSDMLTYKGTFGTTQVVDIPKGTQYTFNYTGSVQSIKLPKGEWKIEAWGAQGGGEANQSYSSHAGLGGYTSGIVNADGNTTYYIYVGGQGTLSSGLGTGAGWNGGGHGGANG